MQTSTPFRLLGISLAALLTIGTADCGFARVLRVAPPEPLISSTNAETPVALRDADVRVQVSGGFAQTTIEMVFHNPNHRQLEGFLNFPLREGQTVSGFALDFNGRLRAAVPVEKNKGQQVFEAIERRRVDPALLEQTAGNQFRLRIFPIPAQGTRRVQLQFVEPLSRQTDAMHYRVPLEFATDAQRLTIHVESQGRDARPTLHLPQRTAPFQRRGNAWYAEAEFTSFRHGGDLELVLPRVSTAQVYTQQFNGENYFLAEIPVPDERVPETFPSRIGLVWDSSASGRKRDIGSELALLDAFFQHVGNVEVELRRLRDREEDAGRFTVRNGDWQTLKQALQTTVYDGASALADWRPARHITTYLLFTDGLANYGSSRSIELADTQRLYVVNTAGSHADGRRLRAWAERNNGVYIDFDSRRLASAIRQLLMRSPRILSQQMTGGYELIHESAVPRDGILRIAGKMRAVSGTLQVSYATAQGRRRDVQLAVVADTQVQQGPIARLWAGYWVDRLAADPEGNRVRTRRLGQQYGLVTPETSLIVLETVQDYVTYDVTPPEELLAQFNAIRATRSDAQHDGRALQANIERAVEGFNAKIQWWERDWPKDPVSTTGVQGDVTFSALPEQEQPTLPSMEDNVRISEAGRARSASMPSMSSPRSAARPSSSVSREHREEVATDAMTYDREIAAIERQSDARQYDRSAGEGTIQIALQPWQPDSPYARRMREAPADRLYQIYLDERDGYLDSTAFYLDVADILLENDQKDLALRVLSNLAEMQLENRHVLRVLAYRLMQVDEPGLAIPLFERVKRLAEEEPQSFRDLGLAYAAAGQPQAAIDTLYEVVQRNWDSRFHDVSTIVLGELNAIVATSKQPLDTSKIDQRLLRNLPLDLRVVLSWDSDNSDMDLWVTDPNGERCYYGHRQTRQGGLLSHDFTGGYGPEEFLLRNAMPGNYKVEANFFGERQQLVTGATTLQLRFQTGFGTVGMQERKISMRLDKRQTVLVGEFEVK